MSNLETIGPEGGRKKMITDASAYVEDDWQEHLAHGGFYVDAYDEEMHVYCVCGNGSQFDITWHDKEEPS